MKARLGAKVVDVLEQAGERHLKKAAPRAYAALLLQVGGADTLREYDASVTYWEHVQVILDHFFTSPERAEILARRWSGAGCTVGPSAAASSTMPVPSDGCRS